MDFSLKICLLYWFFCKISAFKDNILANGEYIVAFQRLFLIYAMRKIGKWLLGWFMQDFLHIMNILCGFCFSTLFFCWFWIAFWLEFLIYFFVFLLLIFCFIYDRSLRYFWFLRYAFIFYDGYMFDPYFVPKIRKIHQKIRKTLCVCY